MYDKGEYCAYGRVEKVIEPKSLGKGQHEGSDLHQRNRKESYNLKTFWTLMYKFTCAPEGMVITVENKLTFFI